MDHPLHYSSTASPHQQLFLASPSPPTSNSNSLLSHMHKNSGVIRFDACLEAPTAASQKLEEPPLTYLNKGQYYTINLRDREGFDGDIISTIAITFHDENHRISAADYWKFWLTQQKNSEEARAVELDLTKSSGVQAIENRQFDRASFKWNGKHGASVQIRFNCLSTDFSRIKGVKGIPLRLQIHCEQVSSSPPQQQHGHQLHLTEKTYCRIKLFRDKGAERKNKDDAKHIERQLEKIRGKNGEPHPLWLAFTPTSAITLFREIVPPDEDDSLYQLQALMDERNSLLQQQQRQQSSLNFNTGSHRIAHHLSGNILLPPPTSLKRSIHQQLHQKGVSASDDNCSITDGGPTIATTVDIDPTYIPQRRRRIAKLSLLVKFSPASDIYRAIYLEHLTVKELIDKLSQRMDDFDPKTTTVSAVLRKIVPKKDEANKKPIFVNVDDEVIQDMNEEQDILIETEKNPGDKSIKIILNF
ncbi:CP2 transcription factor-domain-containing protein [Mycotypha africana]|uniref:CP2 transcription factor-domain-containing protein n=1 Tax=Mycotypha africana TaxID=64632 RepID=UPI002301834F|nr:CP2 transcription factor-domain-containing protein [Mycotypha africana]KAI8982124.1 CP2 transcription factor-domain-containing protein [Mycotypha africana]